MASPDLTDTEVDEICDGYVQNAAKVRFLRSLGVTVERKPNGRPLVSRTHYEAVRGVVSSPDRTPAAPVGPAPKWRIPA